MYNETRVQHVLNMGTHTQDFNCWGATKFIADPETPTLAWVEHDAMGDWLTENFSPIPKKDVKEGDIVALFSPDMRLVHTAYCVGPNRFVHKMGSNVARLETLNRVLKEYSRQAQKYIFVRSKSCV
jgi:hypothetical protein